MGIIDVNLLSETIRNEIKKEVAHRQDHDQSNPHIAIISVGDDEAVKADVELLKEACSTVGFDVSIYDHPASTTELELIQVVKFVGDDEEIHSIMIQTPLPIQINEDKIMATIPLGKDVNRLSIKNTGRVQHNAELFMPIVAASIVSILEKNNIKLAGKKVLMLDKSEDDVFEVQEVLNHHPAFEKAIIQYECIAEGTIPTYADEADLLIVNIGKAESVTRSNIKKNAVVIDLGHHKMVSSYSNEGVVYVGDVNTKGLDEHCSLYASVAGGLTQLYMTMLLKNILYSSLPSHKHTH